MLKSNKRRSISDQNVALFDAKRLQARLASKLIRCGRGLLKKSASERNLDTSLAIDDGTVSHASSSNLSLLLDPTAAQSTEATAAATAAAQATTPKTKRIRHITRKLFSHKSEPSSALEDAYQLPTGIDKPPTGKSSKRNLATKIKKIKLGRDRSFSHVPTPTTNLNLLLEINNSDKCKEETAEEVEKTQHWESSNNQVVLNICQDVTDEKNSELKVEKAHTEGDATSKQQQLEKSMHMLADVREVNTKMDGVHAQAKCLGSESTCLRATTPKPQIGVKSQITFLIFLILFIVLVIFLIVK